MRKLLLILFALLSVSYCQIMISTCAQLQSINSSNSSAFFLLGCDIDCSALNSFIPLQNFSGKIDGNGYKISFIQVSSSNSPAGLIANLTGIVQNLEIEVSSFLGNPAGAFAGIISQGGLLVNCTSQRNKIFCSDSTAAYAGSFTGQNFGTINSCNSYGNGIYSSTQGDGGSAYSGGFAGLQVGNISSSQSYQNNVTSLVSSGGSVMAYSGAFSAYQQGNISNCLSTQNYVNATCTGQSSCQSFAGGISGFQTGSSCDSHSAQNEIIASANSNSSWSGGISGELMNGTITDCTYYENNKNAAHRGDCAAVDKGTISNCVYSDH